MEANRAFRFSQSAPLGLCQLQACQPRDRQPAECPRRQPNLATQPVLSSLIHRSSRRTDNCPTERQPRKLRSKAGRFSRRKAIPRSNRKPPSPAIRLVRPNSPRHRNLSRARRTRPPPPLSNPKATRPRANSPRRSNRRRRIRLSRCHSSLCRLLHRAQLNRKPQHLSNRNSRRRQRGAEFRRSPPCRANRVLPRHRRADRPPLPDSPKLPSSVQLPQVQPRQNAQPRLLRKSHRRRHRLPRRPSRRAASVQRCVRP
jgi:hypothetical protein